MTGEELAEPLYAEAGVERSAMMGLPCLRRDGRFFASLEHRSGALLVKLSRERVDRLIGEGVGEPFAPAGRTFREWVAIPAQGEALWRSLLDEALRHAGAPAGAGFTGFPAAGCEFLAGLEKDNTKAYFDGHRATYERTLLEPAKAFVVAAAAELRERGAPRIQAGPRRAPALLLRITATDVHIGAGVPALGGDPRDAYRAALADPGRVTELDSVVAALMADGAELNEPSSARIPRGIDPEGPAARFAVRDSLSLVRRQEHTSSLATAGFAAWYAAQAEPFLPLHRWLVRHTRASG
ncbi:DUF2461 family protein [Cryptosporangium japonicum]|uniref:Uncharacterized protein n=1 Tax=Cryptosporangium japonicum TaxID=80872 RepID=A0ABP3ESE7_9ACTN